MNDWKRTAGKVMAVLLALRALTNIGKPFGAGTGLVFFGKLLHGLANWILAPALGVYMLLYAHGIWYRRRFALPMGGAYTILVVFNVLLFPVFEGLPPGWSSAAYVAFGILSIASAGFAYWLVLAQREQLT